MSRPLLRLRSRGRGKIAAVIKKGVRPIHGVIDALGQTPFLFIDVYDFRGWKAVKAGA